MYRRPKPCDINGCTQKIDPGNAITIKTSDGSREIRVCDYCRDLLQTGLFRLTRTLRLKPLPATSKNS